MAYQKLQVSNGLAVIPSDTVRIPNPDSEVLSGTADFSVAGVLTDVGTTFTSDGILTNAIVYNTTANKAYYVTGITDDLNLTLSPSDAGGATDNYVIYNEATVGCILFAGVAGDMGIQLAQQNGNANTTELTFKGIAAGAFLPTQAIRVDATKTTATDIIALW
jgi:hypothetical protein